MSTSTIKKDVKMATTYIKNTAAIKAYTTNPSIAALDTTLTTRNQKHYLKNGDKALIIDEGTGEHIGHMGAVFLEQKVVDTEQFIKFYAAGIDEIAMLSSAGLKVFKLIYTMMLENPNNDVFTLDFNTLKMFEKWSYSKSTFHTGMNELLSKSMIFKSIAPAQYFLNIRLFYNGNRVTKVQSYRLKTAQDDLLSDLEPEQ